MKGLKSQVKHFLKSKGVKTIQNEKGQDVKIQQAKTAELIKVATKLGYQEGYNGRE